MPASFTTMRAVSPVWPKLAVNFTAKTQFVYRINKGVLDVSNDRDLNASMPDDSKRVPFTSMIYSGGRPFRRALHEDDAGLRRPGHPLCTRPATAPVWRTCWQRAGWIISSRRTTGPGLRWRPRCRTSSDKMAVTDRLWEENARQVRSIGGDVLLGQVGLF